ncbi:MAG TPA: alpha/beta hydrolase [Polyangiaceae bacterium]|jgi:hypothetical protein
MRRFAVRILVAAVALYATVCVSARTMYRRFVYPAPPMRAAGAAGATGERLSLRASDGVPATALWFAPPDGGRVVAYFHGNGALADDEVPLALDLGRRGLGALLVEYRGYGASAKAAKPDEAGLYADAEAALDEAGRRGVPRERIALWGTSLGTAVAAEMARRGRGSTLVLVSPFTSLTDVAARTAWWLPVSWLLPDRYDTLGKAASIGIPTTIAHGDRDALVPFAMGEALARAIPHATFVPVHGAGHDDVYDVGGASLVDALVSACR